MLANQQGLGGLLVLGFLAGRPRRKYTRMGAQGWGGVVP